jgi:thiamine-phosphate pyrophosphorylase
LLKPPLTLIDAIARNLESGVEWIQIREKDLSARELFHLVRSALALPNPNGSRIIVNTRVDVALAAGAAGAHLPAVSPASKSWRSLVPEGFLIGVSCHAIDKVRAAEAEGADYVLFGPVFVPRSKTSPAEPRGLNGLGQAAQAVRIPVLALGGVTIANAAECVRAGAAGVAAISLYQESAQGC